MRKFLKWVKYILLLLVLFTAGVFAVAYWKRDEILEKLNVYLNDQINGEIHIGRLDFTILHQFPDFSVTLHDVYLRGPQYAVYNHDFFTAEKIFLNIGVFELISKNVNVNSFTLENSKAFIFKTKNGYSNLDIFKKGMMRDSAAIDGEEEKEPFFFKVRKAEFRNVSFVFADSVKNKSMSFQFLRTSHYINGTDSTIAVRINGAMHFDGLVFKEENGPFLKDRLANVDLNARIDRMTKLLTVDSSDLLFDELKVNLTGFFDLTKGGPFQLNFHSESLNVAKGKELLDQHLNYSLRKFEVQKPVAITVHLNGRSVPNDRPAVDVKFSSVDTKVKFGKMNFTGLTFEGLFTNHLDSTKVNDDFNSKVVVSPFQGKMDGFPVKGKVVVTELRNPLVDMEMVTEMNLTELNHHVDSSRFKFSKGTIHTEIRYKGRLSEYANHASVKYYGKLNGKSVIKDGAFKFTSRKLDFSKINGVFEFNENQFLLNTLSFDMNGSPLKMHGSFKNFIPFFIQPKNKGQIQLEITSPHFDLTPLATSKGTSRKTAMQVTQNRKKVSGLVDQIFEKLEFDLKVKIGELTMKQFKATDFTGKIELADHTLKASPVTMLVAGGWMNLDFKLFNLDEDVNPMNVTAHISNAGIKDFFKSFNNFNQQTISDKNLSGSISANVRFDAQLDNNLNVLAPSMVGDIDCRIRDGNLKNFEPMENMSNFLFKKRDFSDVQFAELNSHFDLQGTDLDISRMEIQSSVLSLFIHGRYSFTDSTSLSVQLPLSNLKKRDKDYTPQNVGVDTKVGPSVFLHVYKDKTGKIAIAYDPFKKYAKLN